MKCSVYKNVSYFPEFKSFIVYLTNILSCVLIFTRYFKHFIVSSEGKRKIE
jgi:hypothetical protein